MIAIDPLTKQNSLQIRIVTNLKTFILDVTRGCCFCPYFQLVEPALWWGLFKQEVLAFLAHFRWSLTKAWTFLIPVFLCVSVCNVPISPA